MKMVARSTTSNQIRFQFMRVASCVALAMLIAAGPPARSAGETTAPPVLDNVVRDAQGKRVAPSSVVSIADSLYFLTPNALWCLNKAGESLRSGKGFVVTKIDAPKKLGRVPVQELFAMTSVPARQSIAVLDKSGDLFEYSIPAQKWRLMRDNLPFLHKQPDPHFIDLCAYGNGVVLLDPERNNIWKVSSGARYIKGFFPQMLPWQAKSGDAALGAASAMASDDNVYVIKRGGSITIYGDGDEKRSPQTSFRYTALSAVPHSIRASRLVTARDTPLFVVERDHNRVLAINKSTRKTSQFLFPEGSDLRGLLPRHDGFWVLNNGALEHRDLAHPDEAKKSATRHLVDHRLEKMTMPVPGMRLPGHTGVFPGSRRLYRYGVHAGLDLFYDAGAKTKVKIGTPVTAAEDGKVIRADLHYKELTAPQFARILSDCWNEHKTSEHNENLLRGCQVWLDHGNRLMTRYAHLSRINVSLKEGEIVKTGNLVGFVGISGTGQNLPGRYPEPHLHFEIWLDNHYLGWGLTPTETMQEYEDIFGRK